MKNLLTIAWNKVNSAETLKEIADATAWVNANVSDNDLFDELMTALAFKSRTAYRH